MGDYTSDMTDQVARTDVTVPGAGLTGAPPTGPQPRLRDRLARLGTPRAPVNMALEPILQSQREHHPKAEVALLQRAFEVAERAHQGQTRRSGDDYITHPLSVTQILADLGLTPPTLAAALLHDTVEDTDYSLEDLRRDFGDEIAQLVDGVTKLDKVTWGEAAKAETVRKMVVAMARDIRVLVIKLADRLHNARTWKYLPRERAVRKAQETLEIYAPLAHRLGMNTIKWELEDLAFQALYPKMYDEIVDLVAARAPAREEFLARVCSEVAEDLKVAGIKATVTGRPKHYYSVYQKMIVRGRDFEEIYDLVGVRVLVETVRDCYGALGSLHARWNPGPVQGLHRDPEVQHVPVPAHHGHRAAGQAGRDPDPHPHDAPTGRIRRGGALQVQRRPQARRSRRSRRVRLARRDRLAAPPARLAARDRRPGGVSRLAAFRPRRRRGLRLHTEVGHHCIGGRVNGRLAPLDSVLENGDSVEILTSKADGAGPSRDWLAFVKSPRARNKIRQWFTKERREEAIEQGKDAIAKYLRKQGLPLHRLMSAESLTAVAGDLRYSDIDSLFAAVGDSNVSAQHVVSRLVATLGGEEATSEDLAEATVPSRARSRVRSGDPGVVVVGTDDVWVKVARCCTPVPGDAIIGFITRGNGVSVHREDCTNADALRREPDRLIEVAWDPSAASVFLVQLQVEALDRNRLLSDITRAISDHHVNILAASVQTTRNRVATSRFTFEMGDPGHLDHVIAGILKVEGVYDVYRITGTKRD